MFQAKVTAAPFIQLKMKKTLNTLIEGYSPLKLKDFRIYLSGQSISMLGTWMQQTAQAWVVWELTHSELQLGIAAMLGFLPFLIFGPWSGVWADRLNRRKLLIWTQIIAMILAFVFAFLVQTNLISIWHIYILAALLGIVSTLDLPAQSAFIGDLTGIQNVRKAIVINGAIIQISRMLGPALAGWIISALGVSTAFWLNGLSFIAVILSLIAVHSTQEIHKTQHHALREFYDGLKFIKSQPIILDLLILTLVMTFFAFSAMQIMPAIATKILHGSAGSLGLLMGSSGAGALIGSVLVVPMTHNVRKIGILNSIAVLWAGLWLMIFSWSTNLYFSMLCLFMSATLIPLVFTTSSGLIQVTAPPNMKGRVLSALLIVALGVQPFASIFVGYLAHKIGPADAILVNGTLMVIFTFILIISRKELRRWEVTQSKSL